VGPERATPPRHAGKHQNQLQVGRVRHPQRQLPAAHAASQRVHEHPLAPVTLEHVLRAQMRSNSALAVRTASTGSHVCASCSPALRSARNSPTLRPRVPASPR
jgi:hypothetical protein